MKLTAKMMLVFLLAVMLMTGVASYITVRRSFDRFERHQQQIAQQTATAARAQLAAAWRQEGLPGLLRVLDRIESRHRAERVQVRWVWFSQDVDPRLKPRVSADRWSTVISGQIVSLTSQAEGEPRQLHTYCPIRVSNQAPGGLEFTRSLETLDQQTRDVIFSGLAGISGIALISIAMVYLAGLRWVAQPLERLMEKTQRIGNGDFSEPLPVQGNDELSRLAGALNEMCDQLTQQQQTIREEAAARLATLEQLRHADRLKTVGRLAAGLAHELGTPLNVVSGRASLIAGGKLTAEEVTSSAETIRAEAERITEIVRQLLDFARPKNSHRTRLPLQDLVSQTVELIQPLADERKTHLQLQQPTKPVVVRLDPGQIQQVLTNILMNALQSMPNGGEIAIRLSQQTRAPRDATSEEPRDFAMIAISDQGEGIDPEHIEQVFEPFFTTKPVGEGTGLGLSIAYGIVEEHGGWIEVTSQPGQGSCLTVYLPQNGSDATQQNATPPGK